MFAELAMKAAGKTARTYANSNKAHWSTVGGLARIAFEGGGGFFYRNPKAAMGLMAIGGGAIGGAISGLTADGSSTQGFSQMAEGAAIGATIGFGLRAAPFFARAGAEKVARAGMEKLGRVYKSFGSMTTEDWAALWGTTKERAFKTYETGLRRFDKATGGIAWAMERPNLFIGGAAALGGAAYGISSMTSDVPVYDSPTLEGEIFKPGLPQIDYNQQAIASARTFNIGQLAPTGMIGPAPAVINEQQRRLQRSTYGLVQGMHRSRH